jgi:hypothetical protein
MPIFRRFFRQIDFGILQTGVRSFPTDNIADNLRNARRNGLESNRFRPDRLEAVTNIVPCAELTVSLVRSSDSQPVMKGDLEKVILDLLHNVVFASNSVINTGSVAEP